MSATMTQTETKKAKRSARVYTSTLTVDPRTAMEGVQTPPETPVEATSTTGSGQDSPVVAVIGGTPYGHTEITNMGSVLAQARSEGEFPTTRTPNYNMIATIDDYNRLMQLRELRGGANVARSEWNNNRAAVEFYVNTVRDIRERDETIGEEAAAATVEARVAGMMNGVQAESALYQLIRHAVHSVVQNGGAQQPAVNSGVDITDALRDVDRHLTDMASAQEIGVSAIMNQMRSTIQPHIRREIPDAPGVDMESVFEDVFSVIESSLLDATGPLRLNINRMNGQIDNLDNITQGQVTAIGQHVNAIDSHVHAMGNNVGSMSTLLNSTNGNITAMTTQVGLLQTIVNMLPQMVVQVVREVLPPIVHETVGSAVGNSITNELVGSLQNFVGAMNGARAQASSSGKFASGSNEKGKSGDKKNGKKNGKKGGFMNKFFGFFKKNDRDDGAGPGSSGLGRGMVF